MKEPPNTFLRRFTFFWSLTRSLL